MSTTQCSVSSDVVAVCLTHALSTEHEEIMGLLIGEVNATRVRISAIVVLQRSDKTPDRCEISPEQLSDAAIKADNLSAQLNRPMRVVGWYHSHPHITVWPSHVDVDTQAGYQVMDSAFVGLIFSVFNHNKKTKESEVQFTCFQSQPIGTDPTSVSRSSQYESKEVPLYIDRVAQYETHNLEVLSTLPSILLIEEDEAYKSVHQDENNSHPDLVTQLHNAAVDNTKRFHMNCAILAIGPEWAGTPRSYQLDLYTESVSAIMEALISPLLRVLENRKAENDSTLLSLEAEKQSLVEQLAATFTEETLSSPC